MPTRRSPSPAPQGQSSRTPRPSSPQESLTLKDLIPRPSRGLSTHWGPVPRHHPAVSFPAGIYGPRGTNPPPRVPSLFPSSLFGSVLAFQSRRGSLPPPQTVSGLRSRTRATAPLTFSRRWWRRRTSPAATTEPAPQSQTHRCLRRAPLALLLRAAPPTPTLIGPAPRPSPPPPDPLVRLRAHLQGKTLATRTKPPSRGPLPPPT